tara:strand:- start:35 stop:697 length:663 start_codon:yes stop_codon:yes gene_type:complete
MIQKGLAMKRYKSIKIRKIKYNIYYTIRGIILLPIRLLLLPFKLIGKLLFYRKRKPNKTVLTIIFNKLRNTNERITSLNDIHSHRIDKIAQQVDQNRTRYNLVMVHESQLTQLEADFKRIDKRINELQLSLESMKRKSNKVLKDKPEIIFHPCDESKQLEQLELDVIDSEAKGELVVKELRDEGYDWASERKLKDKQVQDRMRADEAEYDRLSEPVNLDD